jgi:trehalose 6-phosphate synthase
MREPSRSHREGWMNSTADQSWVHQHLHPPPWPAGIGLPKGQRLLVVSNRGPRPPSAVRNDGEASIGGLVTALEPAVAVTGGMWIAAQPVSETDGSEVGNASPGGGVLRVPIPDEEYSAYYHGFANSALWPICHCFTGRCRFERAEYEAYRRVNQRFAEVLDRVARPGDIVWLQDYHLALLPAILKDLRPDLTVVQFWHIPFPPLDLLRINPWWAEIVQSLARNDLLGFHLDRYARNYRECLKAAQGCDLRGATGRTGAFPIGVDAGRLAAAAGTEPCTRMVKRLRARVGGDHLLLGVERLDYSKGIPERLLAIERLLERRPSLRRHLVYYQIAVPSRTRVPAYLELKRRVDELVGRINGRFGSGTWVPIHYRNSALTLEQLVPWYAAADVMIVTPLRDGMNLVAMEFVACRLPGRGGALVLSPLAGAVEQLPGAILANPFDVDGQADAIGSALEMSAVEAEGRMETMRASVFEHDLYSWLESFLKASASSQGERDVAGRRTGRRRRAHAPGSVTGASGTPQ